MFMTTTKPSRRGSSSLPIITMLILFSIITPLLIACDDEGESNDEPQVFGGPTDVGMGGEATGGIMNGNDGDQETFLTYTRIFTEMGMPARGDLVAFNIDSQDEVWLNEGIAKEEMDCVSRGCQLHPSLAWVAWLQPNQSQNDLYIAPINQAEAKVDIANKRLVAENALRFAFTPNNITYSEIKDAEANIGVAVKIGPLDGSEAATEVDLVSANGGFATTLSDDLLIIVKTTLSSMNISLLNSGNGQVFELYTFGEMGGTGSEFSASTNPVRFAPDSSYLVAVTSNEFMWRVHTLEATDAIITPVTRDLFPIRNVPEACSGNYPFINVVNEPVFTKDSNYFYLLFNGDCSIREYPNANRQDYEVYRFSRDLNEEPVNVTKVPRGNHWSNHDIRSFAVSPDESQLAFTSTRPNRNGTYSIWLMNIGSDGAFGDFDCTRNTALPDINGDNRCEYIYFDREGTVEYRNLEFIEAPSF